MSRKKKFEVIKATRRETLTAVDSTGRVLPFGKAGGFTVTDAGEARDIEQSYGQKGTNEVIVVPTDDTPVESGHSYHFGWSRRFERAWERAFDRKRAKTWQSEK